MDSRKWGECGGQNLTSACEPPKPSIGNSKRSKWCNEHHYNIVWIDKVIKKGDTMCNQQDNVDNQQYNYLQFINETRMIVLGFLNFF